MQHRDPDFDFRMQTSLRDGTPVTLRVMRPADHDRRVNALAKLEPS